MPRAHLAKYLVIRSKPQITFVIGDDHTADITAGLFRRLIAASFSIGVHLARSLDLLRHRKLGFLNVFARTFPETGGIVAKHYSYRTENVFRGRVQWPRRRVSNGGQGILK